MLHLKILNRNPDLFWVSSFGRLPMILRSPSLILPLHHGGGENLNAFTS
jgi:hypothetical protein